jgi:hypothetical protein
MDAPKTNVNTNSTRNMKKSAFAMAAALAAIPLNPKTAAIMAMIKNETDHRNMIMIFNCLTKPPMLRPRGESAADPQPILV